MLGGDKSHSNQWDFGALASQLAPQLEGWAQRVHPVGMPTVLGVHSRAGMGQGPLGRSAGAVGDVGAAQDTRLSHESSMHSQLRTRLSAGPSSTANDMTA